MLCTSEEISVAFLISTATLLRLYPLKKKKINDIEKNIYGLRMLG